MNKLITVALVLALVHWSCGSQRRLLNSGDVLMQAPTERVALEIVNDHLFCEVLISGKAYKFILDTGAPTVISMELYEALGLKAERTVTITDTQKNKAKQIITVIPSMGLGGMEFKNIACIAIEMKEMATACYAIDGFIGANLLAELNWEFDYANKVAIGTRDLSHFGVDTFDVALDFIPDNKKTPLVNGVVNGKELKFTFDTGSSGNILVTNDLAHHQAASNGERFITTYGAGSRGLYGAGASERSFTMKQDVELSGRKFEHQLIHGGKSNLVGNLFLKDYIYVIDWTSNKIHLKRRASVAPKVMDGFGVWYRFVEGKARVVELVEGRDIPLKLDDEVLRINTTDLVGLSAEEVCRYELNKVELGAELMRMTVQRGGDTLAVDLTRQMFVE